MMSQLVEGIGAISAAESKKAMFQSGNYQNSVITPVNHAFDNDVVGRDDEDTQDEISPEYDRSENIFSAIEKVGIPTSNNLLTLSWFHSFEKLFA
jgi:hypothetical protein